MQLENFKIVSEEVIDGGGKLIPGLPHWNVKIEMPPPPIPCADLPNFTVFPAEFRRKIWKLALPDPRVVHADTKAASTDSNTIQCRFLQTYRERGELLQSHLAWYDIVLSCEC